MTDDTELRHALRTLRLPIDPRREADAVAAAAQALDANGVAPADRAVLIGLEVERWHDSGKLPAVLGRVAAASIVAGNASLAKELSAGWLAVLPRLVGGSAEMTLDDAISVLSHLRLIAHLATDEHLSAAQIARVMHARDDRLHLTWRTVQTVLSGLRLKPEVSSQQIIALRQNDLRSELDVFADASLGDATSRVADVGRRLGMSDDIEPLLNELFPPEREPFGPYLQMLHYQCLVADFYDHAVSMIYEFAPRGQAAQALFSSYPPGLTAGANPFLNNAKAVDRLDRSWASARTDYPAAAHALVRLLAGLEDLGFAARRELAAWLRWWIHRGLRLRVPASQPLPPRPSAGGVRAILAAVSDAETHTGGVIEQRVVDALAFARHDPKGGWRARGLRDSVNASNVSRRKLGDCDFQLVSDKRVIAYEAHAGRLNEVYLDNHLLTVARVLPLRADEWSWISDIAEWSVTVVFVAHDYTPGVLVRDTYRDDHLGLTVELEHITFDDLVKKSPPFEGLVDDFAELVHAPLNERRTPERVRASYARLYEG
jgi:hypothetical protein